MKPPEGEVGRRPRGREDPPHDANQREVRVALLLSLVPEGNPSPTHTTPRATT